MALPAAVTQTMSRPVPDDVGPAAVPVGPAMGQVEGEGGWMGGGAVGGVEGWSGRGSSVRRGQSSMAIPARECRRRDSQLHPKMGRHHQTREWQWQRRPAERVEGGEGVRGVGVGLAGATRVEMRRRGSGLLRLRVMGVCCEGTGWRHGVWGPAPRLRRSAWLSPLLGAVMSHAGRNVPTWHRPPLYKGRSGGGVCCEYHACFRPPPPDLVAAPLFWPALGSGITAFTS